MIIELTLLITGILSLIIGSYTDIRIREIPDFISFLLIFSSLILRLMSSTLTGEWNFFIYGIIGLLIGLIIGFAMYYFGQWGGGDSKLIMGLFCAFATTPIFFSANLFLNIPFSFLIIFFVNILFAGAAYSLIYSLTLTVIRFKEFKIQFKSQYKKAQKIIFFMLIIFVIAAPASLIYGSLLRWTILSASLIPIAFFFLFVFVKSIESACFIKKYDVDKLREGDWILDEIKLKGKTIYSPKDQGITKEQIDLLSKNKIKFVKVKEGIPFIPAFLIAFIMTYFFGNWVFSLLIPL